ncbi:MAG: LysR family transcriptional regulator [Rhodomicrobiaceae bacterium]
MSDLRSLSLKQLRAFAAVMKTGSVTQAAQQLSVTPPAITTHLKTLESLAGGPILERNADGVAPTALGRELIRVADEMDTIIRRASGRMKSLNSGAEGSVVLGVVSTGKYFAPSIVAAFGRASPGIKVTLSIGNRGDVIAGLERGEFDLLIMGRPPGHIETERVVLGDHPHILIGPPDHRLVNDPEILPEDLLRETFLAREPGSGTRGLMTRFLERIGDGRPFEIVEMGTNETIKQAVMAGLGLAIISQHTCFAELADRRLIALSMPGLPLVRQWYLLHRADHELDAASRALRDFIRTNRTALLPNNMP